MTRRAAKEVYAQAGIDAKDVSVVELHDCFTPNEMCALEGLGLAEEGQAWKLVQNGGITYSKDNKSKLRDDKRWIVNPSGGLISKGHPLGATGLAQCAELGETATTGPTLIHTLTSLLQCGISVDGQRVGRCPRPSIVSNTIWDWVERQWLHYTGALMVGRPRPSRIPGQRTMVDNVWATIRLRKQGQSLKRTGSTPGLLQWTVLTGPRACYRGTSGARCSQKERSFEHTNILCIVKVNSSSLARAGWTQALNSRYMYSVLLPALLLLQYTSLEAISRSASLYH